MKLAVDTRSGEIINSVDLGMGVLEPTALLESWYDENGIPQCPEWFELVDYNGDCTFTDKETVGYVNRYYYTDGVIELRKIANEYTITKGIEELTKKLQDSDYKIIKAYEASLVDKTVLYDFDTIHAERQQYRDEINRLEELLNSIRNDKK